MTNTALVVGASGIVGSNLARHLSDRGWQVLGLARRPPSGLDGVRPIAADLQDPASLRDILASLRPTHVFLATWLRQPTEAENIRVNAAMVRNVLGALSGADTLSHVALVTGLKHYLGPFESYGKGRLPATPFREEQPRLDVENFYYAQEDELFDAARRGGFSWSIHRPHTIIGYAIGNAMNMGTTLAVYATICPRNGAAISLSRLGDAMDRLDGYDGCQIAGAAPGMGRDDDGRARPGIQRRKWRCLPMELDVGATGRLVRVAACPLSRGNFAA
ncbi:nucleoside-diphosphate-sugar epimerase [Bradyrhizobium sp. i1.3.1]